MECSPTEAKDKKCPVIKGVTYCISKDCMAWHELGSLSGYCDLIVNGGK